MWTYRRWLAAHARVYTISKIGLFQKWVSFTGFFSYRNVSFDMWTYRRWLAAHAQVYTILRIGLFYRSLSYKYVSFRIDTSVWHFKILQSAGCAYCVISFTGLFYRSLLTFYFSAVELLRTLRHLFYRSLLQVSFTGLFYRSLLFVSFDVLCFCSRVAAHAVSSLRRYVRN